MVGWLLSGWAWNARQWSQTRPTRPHTQRLRPSAVCRATSITQHRVASSRLWRDQDRIRQHLRLQFQQELWSQEVCHSIDHLVSVRGEATRPGLVLRLRPGQGICTNHLLRADIVVNEPRVQSRELEWGVFRVGVRAAADVALSVQHTRPSQEKPANHVDLGQRARRSTSGDAHRVSQLVFGWSCSPYRAEPLVFSPFVTSNTSQ